MRRSIQGSTLIELMVVLVVAAVLLSMAAPSFVGIMRTSRIATAANGLIASLQLARSEAIKRAVRVTVCAGSEATGCDAGGGWQDGWLVFVDFNENGTFESGDQLLRVIDSVARSVRVSGNDPVSQYVSFVPTGVARQVSGALQMGTISLCDGEIGRSLVLNATGRLRLGVGECS